MKLGFFGASTRPLGSSMPASTSTAMEADVGGSATMRLPALVVRQPALVAKIDPAAADSARHQQLADIGFLPGEPVMVMARGWPGGDPLVVRIGHSTFALRRSEAACIEVQPAPGVER